MTDKEKEAIEYWKRELNHYEYTKDLDLASNNYFGQFEEKINMISGILNLIEKQQAEIEKYKEMYATSIATRVNEAFKQEYKNNEDLEMLYKGCQIELEKKDKIIALMAEQLTTPIHSKEWVIEYYTKKVETEEK